MIDISHQHARRMLRRSLDGRIPEEQWAALQSHLENCAECRAYRAALVVLERDARKTLQSHWEGIPGPQNKLLPVVLSARRGRAKTRQIGFGLAASLVALALFWFFGGTAWIQELFAFNPVAPAGAPLAQQKSTAGPTMTPVATAQAGDVQALVVFSGRSSIGSDSDLYLVNPPEAPVPLLDTPANEWQPAWSPDGAWIAFLSDDTGKAEVFLTTLAGGTPVQISNDPAVEWHGPLAFSPDGRYLALTGVRTNQGNQSWIYLLPTSGGAPVALPGTRGGWAPEFSPSGGRLGFTILEGENRGAAVYYFPQTQTTLTRSPRHWTSPAGQGAPVSTGVFHFQPESSRFAPLADQEIFQAGLGLDWSPDGAGLVYLGSQPEGKGGARVMVEREMDYATSLHDDYQLVSEIAQSTQPDSFQSVTFALNGTVLFLESAAPTNSADTACWTIQMRQMYGSARKSQTLTDGMAENNLCMESGLDASSWTPDGNWLIAVGRAPTETERGLYAVRMPGIFDSLPRPTDTPEPDEIQRSFQTNAVVRLSGLGGVFNTEQLTGAPRVRPSGVMGSRSVIAPVPAPEPVSAFLPDADIRLAPGEIVYALRNNDQSIIARARPDGSAGRVLLANAGNNHCPRFSPDGEWVAFVSDAYGRGSGGGSDIANSAAQLSDELYIMRASDGSQQTNLTSPRTRPQDVSAAQRVQFDCPVWSPDGSLVAAVMKVDNTHFLSVLPTNSDLSLLANPVYLPVGQPVGTPAWTQDGSRLALAHSDNSGNSILQITRIRNLSGAGNEEYLRVLTRSVDGALGIPFSSGPVLTTAGWQAYLLSNMDRPELGTYTVLRRISMEGGGERMPIPLGSDILSASVPGGLARLPEFHLGVILCAGSEDPFKTFVHTFNLRSNQLEIAAALDDEVYSALWSPEGDWVLLNTESGLWAVHVAQGEQVAPLWISPQPIVDMDWNLNAGSWGSSE